MNAKLRSDPKGSIITGVWNASILSDGHLEADARAPTMSEERRHPPFYVWLSPSERFVRVLFVAMVLGFAGTVALSGLSGGSGTLDFTGRFACSKPVGSEG